jgi:hypothetical protein
MGVAMLTALFLLSLIAIALWKPLLRVLLAAVVALLVFAGIQIARMVDSFTTPVPHELVVDSVQAEAVDDGGR